ncbi:SDR family NAD(P)-dependent oxidoreductase [Ferruginibacter yonginensis]|uniref:SDR family NAD(P)-dependent oxidoreductase n=1 Tax=Ferruginibacter yonginensis TaxID=1310416 RepID=A0ABV8QQ64_9BACT
MSKTVFVTGATSGIGKACAEKFAKNGYDVVITGRRVDLLNQVKSHLEKNYSIKVTALEFDVQNRAAVFTSVENIISLHPTIDILINNAGLALGRDAFDEANIDDWETMMNTNVTGLLYITRALMPHLKASKGHIINIGSIAGKEVYENGNAYCASKFAVDALSKAMRIDLVKHGIKVTSVNPGAVETEFSIVRFKGDTTKAKAAYIGYTPLVAADVADTIFYCASLPAHVCINDLTIMSTQQANATMFFKES